MKALKGDLVLILAFCLYCQTKALVLPNSKLGADDVLIDCYPEPDASEDGCVARGCTWAEQDANGAPFCYYPDGYGYSLVGEEIQTDNGYILQLQRKTDQSSIYGNDVETVYLSVEFWTDDLVRLKFYDPNSDRFEVPVPLTVPTSKVTTPNYKVEFTNDPEFGIYIIRNSNQQVIFNTLLPGLVFSDQFIQISTYLPSANLYGLGENRHQQFQHDLNWKTWALFTRDNGPENDYNLYGVQPFYLNVEDDGNTNGVLLLNSNAMEVALQPTALTYRTIGGILDFYILLGPTPEDVIQQYTGLVGRPLMPPYWSMGYQLSRWGYANTDDVRAVVNSVRAANIPYDVQYCDIDYMDGYRDFTLSTTSFADLPDLIDDLHDNGEHFVVILDAGIANAPEDYVAYQSGLKNDVFIKFPNGTLLEGNVWPGNVFYPDFSHVNADAYWTEMAAHLYSNLSVKYDGLWIDMNEVSDFVVGSTGGCEVNNWNYPPYCPNVLGSDPEGKLIDKTICMDAVTSAGKQYDVHSLYGYQMAKTTFTALNNYFPQRRPFVLTRSQYTGSGRYTNHWLGDNESSFSNLRDSIIGILEYNIFGMPFVGADVCGFNSNTTLELCIRWTQLGAFYPFTRNHNAEGNIPQDPPSLGQSMVDATILVLTEKYRLHPFLYTLLHNTHTYGGTVVRSLVHEFPADVNTRSISFQFLWGSALLISPVVQEGDVTVDAYFPSAIWYDYYTGEQVINVGATNTLDAPLDGNIPLHVRGGYILPTQEPSTTTSASRKNPLGVIVALDDNGSATGSLYWDDGESFETEVSKLNNELLYSINQGIFLVTVENNGLGTIPPLNTITIYGQSESPATVTVDGTALPAGQISYDDVSKVLTLSQLNLNLPETHQIQLGQ